MEALFRQVGRTVVASNASRKKFAASGVHQPDREVMTEYAVQQNLQPTRFDVLELLLAPAEVRGLGRYLKDRIARCGTVQMTTR